MVMFKASGLFFSKSLQVPSSLGLTEGKSFKRRSIFVLSKPLSELMIYALPLEVDRFLTVFFCFKFIFSILTLAKVGTVNFWTWLVVLSWTRSRVFLLEMF